MAHELTKSYATGLYRFKYRYRSDADHPWHQEWTQTDPWKHDPTIEEVIYDLEANVEIIKRPVFDQYGQEIPDTFETWRPHTDIAGNQVYENDRPLGAHLGIVGKAYRIMQDYEVVEQFRPWVDAGAVTIETGGAILDGRRFWVLVKVPDNWMEVVPGDEIQQYVLAFNGHDGAGYKIFPTEVRVVCNNTVNLAMRSRLARRLAAKHTKNIMVKADEIRNIVAEMQGLFTENVDKFKTLAACNVKSEKEAKAYFQTVLQQKVDAEVEVKEDGKRPLATLMRLFDGEAMGSDINNISGTYWALYNAVTQFATHMRGRNSDARLDNMLAGHGSEMISRALSVGLDVASGKLDLLN